MSKVVDDQTLIDRHIKRHGVTRCPTVALLPTQATISLADRHDIAAYEQMRDASFREAMMRHRNARQKLKARQTTSLRARGKKG